MICYNLLCIFNKKNTCQQPEIQIDEFGECMQKVRVKDEEQEVLLTVRREMRRYMNGEEAADEADLEDWKAEMLQEWRERNLY